MDSSVREARNAVGDHSGAPLGSAAATTDVGLDSRVERLHGWNEDEVTGGWSVRLGHGTQWRTRNAASGGSSRSRFSSSGARAHLAGPSPGVLPQSAGAGRP